MKAASFQPLFILFAVLALNSGTSYASILKERALANVDDSTALQERGRTWWHSQSHKSASGSVCTRSKQCVSKTCFNGVCLGNTNRPTSAPCQSSYQCNSLDYCSRGQCKVKKAGGISCSSNTQCQSNVCSHHHKKCKAVTSPSSSSSGTPPTTPTLPSSSGTSAPSGTAGFSSAAAAASASATPVSNNGAYTGTGGPLASLGAGTVKASGDVSVVNGKIQIRATSAQPGFIQDTLNQPVAKRQHPERRQASSTIFSFDYAVSGFSATPATAVCQIIPSVNGVNLSPAITITTGSSSGTGNYIVNSGSITSFATAVVCGSGASATVTASNYKFQAMSLPSSTPSSSSSSSSSSSTSSSTSSSSPPTASPSCSGWPSCSFENGSFAEDQEGFFGSSNSGGKCSIVTTYAHSGTHSAMCTLPSVSSSTSETFLDNQEDGYVVGQKYTFIWYTKYVDGATVSGINARAFDIDSVQVPSTLTSAGSDSNGWQQFTFIFTATSGIMEVTIDMKMVGTYYFDDFTMTPSIFPLPPSAASQ